jgi:SAM-dependent methyltransferase
MSDSHCPLCDGSLKPWLGQLTEELTGESFSIVRCERCGFGLTQHKPDDLSKFYSEAYYSGRHGFTTRLCDARRKRWVMASIRERRQPRILDVGCGDGTFLQSMQLAGWQGWGVEISKDNKASGELHCFRTVEDAKDAAPFDCITLWHVLEHLSETERSLATIKNLLKANGKILIAVPNAASLQASIFRKHWLHWDVPRHLVHFSENSLRRLLERCDLEVEWVRYSEFEYDLLGWIQSSINALSRQPNALFKMLTGRAVCLSRTQRTFHWIVGLFIGAIFGPLVLCAPKLGFGATLIVAARLRQNSSKESSDVSK